jgi:hypothetical protein
MFSDDADIGKFYLAMQQTALSKSYRCCADIGKFFTNFGSCLAMSASSVSLFPNGADIAKDYLPMTQTALTKSQII